MERVRYGASVQYRLSTDAFTKVGTFYWKTDIRIQSTQYTNRSIHSQRPVLPITFIKEPSGATPYSVVCSGGDQDLGANFGCSYGGPGKGAITVTASWILGKLDSIQSGGTYEMSTQWFVLYYL
jgi:hypothetical protein